MPVASEHSAEGFLQLRPRLWRAAPLYYCSEPYWALELLEQTVSQRSDFASSVCWVWQMSGQARHS